MVSLSSVQRVNIEDAFLTRAGNFYLDALGQLVTAQGYFVLSADQDIIVLNREEVAAFDISSTGQIIVQTPDGEIEEDFAKLVLLLYKIQLVYVRLEIICTK